MASLKAQHIVGSIQVADLSREKNDEMTYAVCSRLDHPLDQLRSSVVPPMDFDSLWNNDTWKKIQFILNILELTVFTFFSK